MPSFFFPLSVALLKLEGRLNFQHLFYHGSITLGKEAAKVKTKNFMNFYFIKFLAQYFFLNKNDKLV